MARFESSIGSRNVEGNFRTFEVEDPSMQDVNEMSDAELRKLQQKAHQDKIARLNASERMSPAAKQRIEYLCGITTLTKTVEINNIKFTLQSLKNKEYKNAILKFNEALKLAPNNNEAKDLNEKAQKELRVDMKNMYAESVIEENLGNIESAKKKWRTILEQDVPGDAYFDKAKTKLGKYEK